MDLRPELEAQVAFDQVPDLVLVLVRVQRRALPGGTTFSIAVKFPLVWSARTLKFSGPPAGPRMVVPSSDATTIGTA